MSSPQTTITIFRGFKDANAFVWSPYVTKLEARLRFAGVSYKTDVGSPRNGPKGKIPYVELSSPGSSTPEILADSTLIVDALCDRGTLRDLQARLSKVERAHDLALRALLEEKLSAYHTWERWTQNYYTMRDHVLWSLPWPVRALVGSMIHRSTVSTLHGQGTGRFSAEEIGHFRREIWASFADLLLESRSKTPKEDEPFWVLGGPEPTEVDTVMFGFVVSTLLCTAGPESQADLKRFPVLIEYARRIQQQYFPDYEALPA
ncbi:hypothetical protein F5B22DRAFT_88498 [Xylaria bambusicola]|uniref:uncharacterized protein n=1 Tax=Xylaria bambusicola TaxID=326684 RepID=UPI00200745F2|nr:uncharacterized protein F5B22DRAFT_88498 [Xylaria bambusicola]KAI0518028.1 hypothetical protein F5B22DRAFT_88498 [Xylaria bambusicola]